MPVHRIQHRKGQLHQPVYLVCRHIIQQRLFGGVVAKECRVMHPGLRRYLAYRDLLQRLALQQRQ